MSIVGMSSKAKATIPVTSVECPAVIDPTRWKIPSEAKPKRPMENSMNPKASSGLIFE